MLTFRQRELLIFIESYQREHGGVSPNYQEMATGIKVKSKSNICGLLARMEERKLIRRIPNRTRAIEVLKGIGNA